MTHSEKHPDNTPQKTCRLCKSEYWHLSYFGICDKCGYKILIVLFIVMVVMSYIAWFGVL